MKGLALLWISLLPLAACAGGVKVETTTTTSVEASTTSTTGTSDDWLTPAEEYLAAYERALNAHDAIGAAAFHKVDSLVVTPTRVSGVSGGAASNWRCGWPTPTIPVSLSTGPTRS